MRNKNAYKEFVRAYSLEHDRYISVLSKRTLEESIDHLRFLYDIYFMSINNPDHHASFLHYRNKFLGSLFYFAEHLNLEYLKDDEQMSLLLIKPFMSDNDLSNYEVAVKHLDVKGIFNSLVDIVLNNDISIEHLFSIINKYKENFKQERV